MKTKQTKLLMISILMLFHGDLAEKLTHKLKITNSENKIIIYYDTPCDDAISLVKNSKNKYATSMLECNYGYKHSNFMFRQCEIHYRNNWIMSLSELGACNPHYQDERDVIDIIQKPSILSVATNLLKSVFSPGKKENIIHNIKNDYNISNHLTLSIMRDSFTNNTNIIREADAAASNQMPPDIWGLYQAHKSISQKSALIRTIARTCRETSTLNTRAISELIENPNFLQIEKNSTQMMGVEVDFEKAKITITYRLHLKMLVEEHGDKLETIFDESEPEPKTSYPNLIILSLIFLVLISILVLYAIFV